MKLRNIFLAGLAVCTMAGCSKDETTDYSQMGEVDAYVSFGVTAALQTKSTVGEGGNEIEKEAKVQKLTALIFKGTDDNATFVTSETETVEGNETIRDIKHLVVKVTPTADGTSSIDNFIVVFLGNCKDISTPATLGALKNMVLTENADSYAIGSVLPMVSKEIKITGLRPNIKKEDGSTGWYENWVKDNGGVVTDATVSQEDPQTPPSNYTSADHVVLTRLISRVQVESVKLKLTAYPGASITLRKIALANVKIQSEFAESTGDYVRGYESEQYRPVQYWIAPNSTVNENYISVDYALTAGNGEEKTETFSENKFVKYIFSNAKRTASNVDAAHTDGIYETGIILVVDFKNAAGVVSTKHMRVLLKDNGTDDVPEVLMNHVYKLNITITGEGSENEDDIKLNAHVAATIDVAPWNVIEQNEEDAN